MDARRFIFKNTVTSEVLVLPVTPAGYQISHGPKAVQVDMHGVGTINLPGEQTLLDETIECFFPARAYPFNDSSAGTDPFVPLETLERWCDSRTPVRFIVSGTPVNALVLLDPIQYGERDGTKDVYVTIPMRGYRILTAPVSELEETGNAQRAQETAPAHGATYVVKRGDTLSAIAKWAYGNASLAGKIAAANGIKNPNLIYAGQVIQLPDVKALPAAAAVTGTAKLAQKVETTKKTSQQPGKRDNKVWDIQLKKEEAQGLIAERKLPTPDHVLNLFDVYFK